MCLPHSPDLAQVRFCGGTHPYWVSLRIEHYHIINDPLVEETLYSILHTTPVSHEHVVPTSYEHVVAIAETLSEGAKYLGECDTDYTPSLELQSADL